MSQLEQSSSQEEQQQASDDDMSNKRGDYEYQQLQKLTARESRRMTICGSLYCILLLFAGCAFIALGQLAYESQMRAAYDQAYAAAVDAIQASVQYQLNALTLAGGSLSETLQQQQQEWPFVTLINEFELVFQPVRQTSSGIQWMGFCPLVPAFELESWANYSVEIAPEWLQASWQQHGSTTPNETISIASNVFRFDDNVQVVDETGISEYPVAPLWQMSPPPLTQAQAFGINFNGLSEPWLQEPYNVLEEETSVVLVSGTKAVHDLNLPVVVVTTNTEQQQPYSMLVNAIYDDNDETNLLVGLGMSILRWDAYLEHVVLPEVLSGGLFVVLSNPCHNETYTYELQQGQAYFWGSGDGDVHDDRRFDSKRRAAATILVLDPNNNGDVVTAMNASSYAAFLQQQASSACLYTFTIYPTETFLKNGGSSTWSLTSAVLSGTVVLILAMGFLCFVWIARSKMTKLMQAAVRSHSIVSTLFPRKTRDLLLLEEQPSDKKIRYFGKDQLLVLMGNSSSPIGEQHNNIHPPPSRSSSRGGGNGGGDASTSTVGADCFLESSSDLMFRTPPIADLFNQTTVLFADIVGFSAWSSVRQPVHVFRLLETLYHAFDNIAERRGVFKVETLGDSYVAVCGLPEPKPNHAVVMCEFAMECLEKMHDLTKSLEAELGPDTDELCMRFGLHSGPVTAGVQRGKRSRFQMFGDTINLASRMETTSKRGRIQLSQDTGDLLVAAGKGDWLLKREELLFCKGRGDMQTYWLQVEPVKLTTPAAAVSAENKDKTTTDDPVVEHMMSDRIVRLIDWNVNVLKKLLREIGARRVSKRNAQQPPEQKDNEHLIFRRDDSTTTVFDEVREIISLPAYDAKIAMRQRDPNTVILGQEVELQLQQYVTEIASMYNDNAFHNFEHCSHVVMSVSKLLSRIVAPADLSYVKSSSLILRAAIQTRKVDNELQAFLLNRASQRSLDNAAAAFLLEEEQASGGGQSPPPVKANKSQHDHTYGITSDPLTRFACVFSALIHDANHTGVPNTQLMVEKPNLAAVYQNKSVAEQISVDLAWNLLMEDQYTALRSAIYTDKAELKRFRQLVVNSVMATDIMDKELKALRNGRWDKAFKLNDATDHNYDDDSDNNTEDSDDHHRENVNRKATIVIEHIIQASDIAHTMQHWHVYRRWNECLFREMRQAFVEGRAAKDPAEFWYKGEIGFFDFYIIPLAKKLKDCGVFGASSAECLNYAQLNRREWERKGQAVVAEMVEKYSNNMSSSTVDIAPTAPPPPPESAPPASPKAVAVAAAAVAVEGTDTTNHAKLPPAEEAQQEQGEVSHHDQEEERAAPTTPPPASAKSVSSSVDSSADDLCPDCSRLGNNHHHNNNEHLLVTPSTVASTAAAATPPPPQPQNNGTTNGVKQLAAAGDGGLLIPTTGSGDESKAVEPTRQYFM